MGLCGHPECGQTASSLKQNPWHTSHTPAPPATPPAPPPALPPALPQAPPKSADSNSLGGQVSEYLPAMRRTQTCRGGWRQRRAPPCLPTSLSTLASRPCTNRLLTWRSWYAKHVFLTRDMLRVQPTWPTSLVTWSPGTCPTSTT